MNINKLTGAFLSAFAALSLQRAAAQPLDLSLYTTSGSGFYTNTFDSLGYSTNQTQDGTPSGPQGYLAGEWACYIGATANYYGTLASVAPNVSSPGSLNNWTNPFIGGFFNYASYFSYITNSSGITNNPYTIAGTNLYYTNGFPVYITNGVAINGGVVTNGVITDPTYQTNEPNRCLGIRQTGTTYDPGAAFVLKLANTLAYANFKLWVDLINLDPTSPRTTTWQIQYGIADPVYGVPTAFQNLTTLTSSFTDNPGSNHWKTVNLTGLNGTINNYNGEVWLRIVTLANSTGSGNRETFAIDNFGLTWTTTNVGCTPVTATPGIVPAGTNIVYVNSAAQFTVTEPGNQPKYYQWLFNNQPVGDVFPGQVLYGSDRSSILSLQGMTAENQGTYSCIVSNICGGTLYSNQSPGSFLVVTNVPSVSLGYLRTLTDPTSWTTDASASQLWQVTGMITTLTNTTTGNTASYYIQDATGGMNLFVTGGSAFRPNLGDEVTAVGYLDTYQGNLEIEVDLTGNIISGCSVTNNDNDIANYPVAKVLNWATEFAIGVTNKAVELGTTNSLGALTGLGSKKGSICLLTNVYFGTNAGTVITGNSYAYVTNAAGLGGYVYFWGGLDTNLTGYVVPAFAYAVQGVLFANVVSGAGSFWSGIGVSQPADIMTNPIVLSGARAGTSSTISWTAVPYTYSYNVLASPNVAGPYAPIATALKFSTSAASYTDVNNASSQYYRVTTP